MPPNDRYRPSVATPQSEGVAAALARERGRLTDSNPLLAGANAFRTYAEPEGMNHKDRFTSTVARALLGSLSEWGGQQMVDSSYNDFSQRATDSSLEALRGDSRYTDVYNARRNEQDILEREAIAKAAELERLPMEYKTLPAGDGRDIDAILDPRTGKYSPLGSIYTPKTGGNVTVNNNAPQFIESAAYDELNAGEVAQNQSLDVLDALSGFDDDENLGEAIIRGTAAGWLPDSEAADLKRRIDEAVFAALKPNFPGAVSDEERTALTAVKGGNLGVPVGMLRRIWERTYKNSAKKGNTFLARGNEYQKAQGKPPLPFSFLPTEIPGRGGGESTSDELKRLNAENDALEKSLRVR